MGVDVLPLILWVIFYSFIKLLSARTISSGQLDVSTQRALVLGSDHPHQIGGMANCVERINNLDISDEDKEKILWGNAAKLLKI